MKEALGLSRKKRHKEHYALQGVDMTVYQGETVGIIGTNGSGKSTILKIITGVLNPTKGNLTVNGRNVRYYLVGGDYEPTYVSDGGVVDLNGGAGGKYICTFEDGKFEFKEK